MPYRIPESKRLSVPENSTETVCMCTMTPGICKHTSLVQLLELGDLPLITMQMLCFWRINIPSIIAVVRPDEIITFLPCYTSTSLSGAVR